MTNGMKWNTWTSVCCIALLISGCAKRQTGPGLVYVASPPPATSAAPEQDSGTLMIEEPATPEPEKLPLQEPSELLNTPLSIPSSPKKSPSASSSPADALPEAPPVEPPPLEPAKNVGQADRQKIQNTQNDVFVRLAQFESTRHSDAEKQTLAQARAFLDQSKSALKDGDLPRAKSLADKALLLITALEKGP
jgi:hypothetical protein